MDLELARKRPDLMFANRTLQGARPPKGQELEDHYFGTIKERVLGFMQEVELECFKLGIPAKTRHNEVAPNQFELAPIYEPANIAADHNQLMMELLKAVGERHGLAALLHEKPFSGVNGSGKHVNWSMGTRRRPQPAGSGPRRRRRTCSSCTSWAPTLKAIHRHGGLLRAAIAFAGNDHRLGANEAPPAIMSAFLGSQLNLILEAIERGDVADASGAARSWTWASPSLPVLEKDATDRNRTSPFAFTGNKFEFRAVGSSQAIAVPATRASTPPWPRPWTTMNARMDAELKARQARAAARGHGGDPRRHHRDPGDPLRRQQLLRGVAAGGRAARPAPRQEHRRPPCSIWDDTACRQVFTRKGILSGRGAGGAHPHPPRAVRRRSSGSRRRCCARWPRPCCCRRS